jgi:hypothetical protein
VLRWVAMGAGLVLVVAAGLGLAAYRKFSANIRTDTAAERVLAQYAGERPPVLAPGAQNVLVLEAVPGTENGTGATAAAVLLHLSAGRHRAAALGVPRDLMVAAPSCVRPDGGTSPAAYEPFGEAFRGGGAACSIRVFERLSGIRVDHHLVVDAAGFAKIAATVGSHADRDRTDRDRSDQDRSDQDRTDGSRTDGSLTDGDPTDRSRTLDREGELPRALLHAARGGGTLTHPARLYGLLDTATSAITADPGLSSLPALYELAGSLRALESRTVPAVAREASKAPARAPGRRPRQPQAEQLFAAVRADRPLPAASAS